jgi:hypothetical protein
VAVIGASGCGKSSLVRAGLFPKLKRSKSQTWRCLAVQPESTPFDNLARKLQVAATDGEFDGDIGLSRLHGTLLNSSRGLLEAVDEMNLAIDERLLIVIDQFEELIRYDQKDIDTSLKFIRLLLRSAKKSDGRINLLITMRLDFLADCARYPGLTEYINKGQYLVPALDRYQRMSAIEKPSEMAGRKFDWPLVQALLNDADDAHDQLPVLQHGLMRLWNVSSKSPKVTLDHYKRIGRLSKAIENHADQIYDDLSRFEKIMAERLFKALTRLDEQGRGIRRPQKLRAW